MPPPFFTVSPRSKSSTSQHHTEEFLQWKHRKRIPAQIAGTRDATRCRFSSRVILREGKRVPAGAHVASLDGLPYDRVLDLEGRRRRSHAAP